MKVLQISKYYYPHIGGIEQVARDIANALKGKYEQKVFCFNSEKNDSTDIVDDVEIVRAGSFVKVASQSLSLRYGKLLRKTVDDFKPDVIIFHYPNPFGAHYLLKILKKYPDVKLVVYWHLDIFKQKFLKLFFKGQTKRLCKRATKIVAATPTHLECSEYYRYFKSKCEVLPYKINEKDLILNDMEVERVKQIKESGKFICFALGRHVPYKGMIYLVQAAMLLDDQFVVYIGGVGPETKRIKKVAKNRKNIVFLGKISESEKRIYMNSCDVFCFPSITKNEAFGLALAEAMYCGKPAVTFTIPGSGVNYVGLNDITCLEVKNSDSDKFAEAIKKLAVNEDMRKRMGENAKNRVCEMYSTDVFEKKIIQFLRGLK